MPNSDIFVTFTTSLGDFVVDLYASTTPNTVQNFLSYLPAYQQSGNFMHRLVSGFVLQGGGYRLADGNVVTNPQGPPVAHEAGPSNTARTIAVATVSGDPNSGTNQFFFNLADNPSLDGGYTVFGSVSRGWNTVTAIATLPVVDAGGAFGQLPVRNYTSGPITGDNLVIFSVSRLDAPLVVSALNAGVAERTSLSGSALDGAYDAAFGDTLRIASAHASAAPEQQIGSGGAVLAGSYGHLTLRSDGSYTYLTDAEGLTTGTVYADDFVITVANQHGLTTTALLHYLVSGSPSGDASANTVVGSAASDVLQAARAMTR